MALRGRCVVVCALGLLLAGRTVAQDEAPPTPVFDFTGRPALNVVRVVDGDTIVVRDGESDRTVRLIGVDTPETVDPRRPVQAFGREASTFTANLLKGERVWLRSDGDRPRTDRYGRALAYVFRYPEGLFVNLEIVRQGYGLAYTVFPFEYKKLFLYYERGAREAGKGVWGARRSAVDDAGETDKSIAGPRTEVAPDRASFFTNNLTDTPDPDAEPGQGSEDGTLSATVFVTKTGDKYHRNGCRHLNQSRIAIEPEDARRRYRPCSVCRPP
jgi:micrococcal nuclease